MGNVNTITPNTKKMGVAFVFMAVICNQMHINWKSKRKKKRNCILCETDQDETDAKSSIDSWHLM